MAVHTLKCIHRHGEKASGLPLWNARLHEPCRARVPEGMRGNARTAEACPCHGSPEALFYAPDGLAVLIHYGAERRPPTSSVSEMRQQSRRNLRVRSLFLRLLTSR